MRKNSKVVALSFDESGKCVFLAEVKNLNSDELNKVQNECENEQLKLLEEKKALQETIAQIIVKLNELEQEIKVLKGE